MLKDAQVKRIMELKKNNPKMSYAKIAKEVGVSKNSVMKCLTRENSLSQPIVKPASDDSIKTLMKRVNLLETDVERICEDVAAVTTALESLTIMRCKNCGAFLKLLATCPNCQNQYLVRSIAS